MKNLKKVTAGFLSLSLLTCVGAAQAFAVSPITAEGGTDTKEATVGTVKALEDTYSVKIDWGTLKYDYVEEWNTTDFTSTHKWQASAKDSDKITITNNSNVDIKATFAFVSASEGKNYSGVSGKFYSDSEYQIPLNAGNNDALTLDKASNGSKAPTGDAHMELKGDPTDTPAAGDTIGTVTVTVSKRDEG